MFARWHGSLPPTNVNLLHASALFAGDHEDLVDQRNFMQSALHRREEFHKRGRSPLTSQHASRCVSPQNMDQQ